MNTITIPMEVDNYGVCHWLNQRIREVRMGYTQRVRVAQEIRRCLHGIPASLALRAVDEERVLCFFPKSLHIFIQTKDQLLPYEYDYMVYGTDWPYA